MGKGRELLLFFNLYITCVMTLIFRFCSGLGNQFQRLRSVTRVFSHIQLHPLLAEICYCNGFSDDLVDIIRNQKTSLFAPNSREMCTMLHSVMAQSRTAKVDHVAIKLTSLRQFVTTIQYVTSLSPKCFLSRLMHYNLKNNNYIF